MSASNLPKELNFLAPLKGLELIRVGAWHDGGYVVPESAILKADALLSLGISTDWSFDEGFIKLNPQSFVHGYDHTVSERLFKRGLRKSISRFMTLRGPFSKITESLELLKNYQNFFSGKNQHYQQRIHSSNQSPTDATIDSVFERVPSKNIFLKIDIEGSEYRIIDDILRHAPQITGIAIEFHDTDHLRLVFYDSVQKLLRNFEIAHIHGNNCSPCAADGLPDALEISFINKSLVPAGLSRQSSLPLEGLDVSNRSHLADYPLRFSL